MKTIEQINIRMEELKNDLRYIREKKYNNEEVREKAIMATSIIAMIAAMAWVIDEKKSESET